MRKTRGTPFNLLTKQWAQKPSNLRFPNVLHPQLYGSLFSLHIDETLQLLCRIFSVGCPKDCHRISTRFQRDSHSSSCRKSSAGRSLRGFHRIAIGYQQDFNTISYRSSCRKSSAGLLLWDFHRIATGFQQFPTAAPAGNHLQDFVGFHRIGQRISTRFQHHFL